MSETVIYIVGVCFIMIFYSLKTNETFMIWVICSIWTWCIKVLQFFFILQQLSSNTPVPSLVDNHGNPVDDSAAKAELFNEFFSSVYTVDNGILTDFPPCIESSAYIESVIFTPFCIIAELQRLKRSLTT